MSLWRNECVEGCTCLRIAPCAGSARPRHVRQSNPCKNRIGTWMIPSAPLISVVIPTINRPQLVTGAVDSVLRQSLRDIEVIVVIDGPDEATQRVLQTIDDPR